jgi:hypothetical protein
MDVDEREALIRMVCDALCSKSWAAIDTFLQAHELELHQWERGRFAYAHRSVLEANPENLIPMSLELELIPSLWEREARNPWKPAYFRLFFSHSSNDRAYVAAVATALDVYGISGFVAHEDIEPQAAWMNVIEYALGTAHALVAFVNEDFAASVWCNQEVGWVLGRETLATSIMMSKSPVGFTSRFQGIPLTGEPQEQAWRVFQVLARARKTSAVLAESLINKLEESETWEIVTSRSRYLLECRHWPPHTLERLADAVRQVRKVREAWGVPGVVEELFTRAHQQVPGDVQDLLRANQASRHR